MRCHPLETFCSPAWASSSDESSSRSRTLSKPVRHSLEVVWIVKLHSLMKIICWIIWLWKLFKSVPVVVVERDWKTAFPFEEPTLWERLFAQNCRECPHKIFSSLKSKVNVNSSYAEIRIIIITSSLLHFKHVCGRWWLRWKCILLHRTRHRRLILDGHLLRCHLPGHLLRCHLTNRLSSRLRAGLHWSVLIHLRHLRLLLWHAGLLQIAHLRRWLEALGFSSIRVFVDPFLCRLIPQNLQDICPSTNHSFEWALLDLTVGFLSSGKIIWFLGFIDSLLMKPPNQPLPEAEASGAAPFLAFVAASWPFAGEFFLSSTSAMFFDFWAASSLSETEFPIEIVGVGCW